MCDILFWCACIKTIKIVNKFLLAGDKFMPEMHLKQRGFTYSACGPFTIYKNELDKACFQHDMA